MQTHVQHPWGSEPLQAHLVGQSGRSPLKPVRSKYEAGRGTGPAAPGGPFHPQRLHGFPPIPHFPWVLRGKAFSSGVAFEKESNRLSLCIIACSRTSPRWAPRAPCVQVPDPAGSGGCWGCSLQGTSFQELTEAATHMPLLSRHCHLLAILPPSSVLQMSSLPVLSLAEQSHPLNSGRAGSQISLPVCSTEKHIIFLCRDRNVFLIYHLLCLGLLLDSVLFLFLKICLLF